MFPSIFDIQPKRVSWGDNKYYPIRSYEDQYIKWTMLRQGRDQDVPKFTNIFHTLRIKFGIKDSK